KSAGKGCRTPRGRRVSGTWAKRSSNDWIGAVAIVNLQSKAPLCLEIPHSTQPPPPRFAKFDYAVLLWPGGHLLTKIGTSVRVASSGPTMRDTRGQIYFFGCAARGRGWMRRACFQAWPEGTSPDQTKPGSLGS